jgi:hypothetical protein
MDTDDETTDEENTGTEGDWLAEQVQLITLEDGFQD